MGAQEDYEALTSQAERLGLEDKDRENFINSSMQRYGYKPRMSWDEPDEDDGGGGGGSDFFARSQKRQSRDVSGGQPRGNQRSNRQQSYGYGD